MSFNKMVANLRVKQHNARCFLRSTLLLTVLVLLNNGCTQLQSPAFDRGKNPPVFASPTPSAETVPYVPDQFGEVLGDSIKTYTVENTLSYKGYEIVKSRRKSKSGPSKGTNEIEYASLRHNGQVVTEFDSVIDQLSEARFGLFSFLDKDDKQLLIEQTSNKFWRYWIVSLQPNFRILYDSGKYDVVYELRTVDLDGDGHLEIILNLGTFWYFHLDNVYSPRPPIIFKYNSRTGKYIPANPEFKEAVLKDIEQRISKTREVIERKDDPLYALHVRSAVFDVVLRYVYAGKSNEAWTFYDQHYVLEGKESMKAELKKKLKQDAVYKAIQAQAEKI